jgi:PAS domain S-box-containing protein
VRWRTAEGRDRPGRQQLTWRYLPALLLVALLSAGTFVALAEVDVAGGPRLLIALVAMAIVLAQGLLVLRPMTRRMAAAETRLRDALAAEQARVTELRHAEALRATIVANAPLVLYAFDRDGTFTFFDGQGLAALGLRPGEVVGRSVFDLDTGVPQILDDIRRALAGQACGSTVEVAGRVFESAYQPLRDEGGEVTGVVGVATDVTDQVHLRRELEHRAFHDGLTGTHAAVVGRLELGAELRRAIADGQLTVHYQPTVVLGEGDITGMEALVRWQHPTRGLVPPADFIPLAEETGLIAPLGRFVLGEACRQAKAWQDRYPSRRPLTMAVNLSGRQLQHPGIVAEVAEALAASGLPPATLTLEITETVIMESLEVAARVLGELRGLGVRLALDDFGTGYSSLSYLRQLPVDLLKIDRSFVAGVTRGPEDSAVARAVIKLAEALGLATLAEGIETTEQAFALRALGCQLGQGYLFARPLDPEAAEQLLGRARTAAAAR